MAAIYRGICATLFVVFAAAAGSPAHGQPPALAGRVVDSSGAPVPDAIVRLESGGVPVADVRTARDGVFTFAIDASGPLRVVVTAAGFAQGMAPVTADRGDILITLEPAPFFEAVNVTSSRTDLPRADPTVTVTVVQASELLTSAAATLDDALKLVPGFTLFRRTSSRVSNPTAQGITLRGLGGTGASRSLVLADGVPLNDAFGGWVYWDKVPQAAIDRVEVQRGSGSDLYGADAVGGVVQILTVRPGRRTARALVEGGTLGTGRVSLFGGGRHRGFAYTAAGEWFSTDGYVTVARRQDAGISPRGPIDVAAGSTHRSALMSAGYQSTSGWRVEGRASVFAEDRANGTPAVVNDTDARQAAAEITGGVGGGLLAVRLFGGTQGYDQSFSTVSVDRRSEALNRVQRVPTRVFGAGAQWIHPWGRHLMLIGAESRFIRGSTIETPFSQGRPLATTEAGGIQRVGSAFAQGTFNVSDEVTMVAGMHADGWHSESRNTGYDKTLGSLNPRASLAYRLPGTDISLRGSAYWGFRAPTLNELYRGFRAGNTDTRPDEALAPERLRGGEAGILFARGRASARATGFWNVLDDTITNITLSMTPTLITKQRANADRMRAAGVELEGDLRLPASLSLSFAGAVVRSRFAGDTTLRGNRVPQVPRFNAGLNLRYNGADWAASTQIRVTGPQFEDDLNLYLLRRATVADVYASRRVAGVMSAFVACENLFDAEYDVGRTPILTTGLPRAVRAGVLLWIR
jgi:outer membrane receptor protein involved in Fe transport